MELLLEAKADQDKTALCGKTALHEAAEVGQLKVVRLLLQAAVDMNKVTRSGTTALQLALVFGHQAAQLNMSVPSSNSVHPDSPRRALIASGELAHQTRKSSGARTLRSLSRFLKTDW